MPKSLKEMMLDKLLEDKYLTVQSFKSKELTPNDATEKLLQLNSIRIYELAIEKAIKIVRDTNPLGLIHSSNVSSIS